MPQDRSKSSTSDLRRWIIAAAPAIVWLGAISVATSLYFKRHRYETIGAFAEERSITIAPSEMSVVREVPVRLHQMVEPGEVLVRMDDRFENSRLSELNQSTSPVAADAREREIQDLTHRIDQKVHRAPTRGQIAALLVQAGDTVQPGTPMVVLAPVATQRVVAFLPEKQLHAIGVGSGVTVRPAAPRSKGTPLIDAVVVSMSESVREAPSRFRKSPLSPIWGREVIVLVNERAQLIPGEAVTLTWRHN